MQQLSQFWYDDETVNQLVKGAIECTKPDGKIALVSCPTLYRALKEKACDRQGNIYTQLKKIFKILNTIFTFSVTLFEYDRRFASYGKDFIFYDYRAPLEIARDMSSDFDLVIADPPFLSDECLTKTSVTVKFLSKNNIVICTGTFQYITVSLQLP